MVKLILQTLNTGNTYFFNFLRTTSNAYSGYEKILECDMKIFDLFRGYVLNKRLNKKR